MLVGSKVGGFYKFGIMKLKAVLAGYRVELLNPFLMNIYLVVVSIDTVGGDVGKLTKVLA